MSFVFLFKSFAKVTSLKTKKKHQLKNYRHSAPVIDAIATDEGKCNLSDSCKGHFVKELIGTQVSGIRIYGNGHVTHQVHWNYISHLLTDFVLIFAYR